MVFDDWAGVDSPLNRVIYPNGSASEPKLACDNRQPWRDELTAAKGGKAMLRWAAIFFVIAIIAALLGFTGIAGAAAEVAKFLFFLFIAIFVIILVLAIFTGSKIP
jgi:uncharacterized membrane protein YtjA (UPF0391 family)